MGVAVPVCATIVMIGVVVVVRAVVVRAVVAVVITMVMVRLGMTVVVNSASVVVVSHRPLPLQILVDDFDELFGGEHLR
jgi:hypothetical protein